MRAPIGTVLALASYFASLWGCESSGGPFKASYEPGFAHASGMTVSVFGVYKDGRMSADSWKQIAPSFSSLGNGCEIAYNDTLSLAPELSTAVDDYARAEGPTDALLNQFAPSASGDQMMLVTISGHPPETHRADAGARSQQRGGGMQGGGRGMGGMGGGGRGMGRRGGMGAPPGGSEAHETSDGSVFEISASLFSVRQHRTVGALTLTYSGDSVDEAFSQFKEKFQQELPNARCAGWHWETPIDPANVRNTQ